MSSPDSARNEAPSVWLRWRLTGLITVGVLTVLFILYLGRGALLPIVMSIIVAALIFPLVSYIERVLPIHSRHPRVARLVAIAAVYAAFLAVMAGFLFLTVQPLYREAREFFQTAPDIYDEAQSTVEGWLEDYDRQVPEDVQAQIEEWLRSASGAIGDAALAILTRTLSGITGTVSLVVGLVVVPFLLFYMLKDKEELVGGMYSMLPENVSRHTHNVLNLVHGVIGSYIRAQLLSATIVGVFVYLGLLLLDVSFALTLGLLAGVLGLIPIVGAYIGAVPGLLVALATDPGKLPWVALVYIIVQLVESNVIAPRIQGRALRLHPIFIMATLIVASEIAGLWGVFVGVPLVAVARDLFAYFYHEWSDHGGPSSELEALEETDAPQIADEEPASQTPLPGGESQ
ncbi:MAG: AI-2E family transporter [Chloroflexota bacterium]|nr:AI-2E family transporter [Chloroflexota bacterium]MDE2941521.1 AI-2E family transporter [Chloroflexota bacterium]MDE3267740.1 AI-2E family transporter [Chloroflexota bacterium]